MSLLNWFLYGIKPYEPTPMEKIELVKDLLDRGVLTTDELLTVLEIDRPD